MPKCKHLWYHDLDHDQSIEFFLKIQENEKLDNLEKFDIMDKVLTEKFFCTKCMKSYDESLQSKM